MSRAHAVAPMVGADAPFRGPVQGVRPPAPRVPRRSVRPATSCYLERAMLLWPRLDRAKIRKVADDPARIAEIVERRTSQPFDVILAMLTKQSAAAHGPDGRGIRLRLRTRRRLPRRTAHRPERGRQRDPGSGPAAGLTLGRTRRIDHLPRSLARNGESRFAATCCRRVFSGGSARFPAIRLFWEASGSARPT